MASTTPTSTSTPTSSCRRFDALEEFKVQTGHLLGGVRTSRGPGERRDQVGLERLPRHGLRVPPQRRVDARPCAFTAAQAARKNQLQVESVRLCGHRPDLQEPRVLHVELGLPGQQDVPEQLHRADGGHAVGDFSALHTAPRSGDLRRRLEPDVRRSRATAFRQSGSIRSRSSCSSSIRSRTPRHGQQLRRARRSRDRPEAHPAHGLRPGSSLNWMGATAGAMTMK